MTTAVVETIIPGLPLFRRGKVRDAFRVPHPDGDRLLLVATDRLSAFDVLLPTPIPGKGILLTQLSAFWFGVTRHIVPNHLLSTDVADFPPAARAMADQLAGRTMLTRLAERIDIECIVRGYLAGTGWADYRRTGAVCGHALPPGLRESERLPEPLFTPAGKNDTGHDENISVAAMADRVGADLTRRLADLSRQLYDFAAAHALARGIIIADAKFEFGLLDGAIILIDEALTPDSSRFWEVDQYAPGRAQPSLDKQFVRDWLAASGWNKEPPGPDLPPDVVEGTLARYRSAVARLTQAQ